MSAAVIGVDVGGTKVAAAMLHDHELSATRLEASDHTDAATLVDQLATVIVEQTAAANQPIAAVGIGVPSVIDFASGRVRSTVNLPLSDVALRDVLQERVSLPVFVDNDANCAALAEAHDEDGHLDVRHLVMFTLGTGVGGGIIINGRIYRGATGAAAEFGHQVIGLPMEDRVPEASEHFPQHGSLEWLAAGRGLDRLAEAAARKHPDSALGRLAAAGEAVAGPDVVRTAHEGDETSVAAIRLLGRRLGVGIANAINVFDPEVVAVGGGVSSAGELLIEAARETARQYTLPGVGTSTEIRLARSGPQAGVRGAALLAVQELAHDSPALRPARAS